MKNFRLLALFLLLPLRLYGQCAGVQSCTVSALDSTTIQNALNSVNTENTTLILPAGSATWTVRVTYSQPFALKIIGKGNPTGSDALGNPTGYNDQTILLDNVADSNNPGQYFSATTTAGKMFRITGVTFQTSPSQTFQSFHGIVSFAGNSPAFRFDHNHVKVSLGTEAFVYNGGLRGVMDHNFFEMTGGAVVNFIEMQGSGYKGLSESAGGDQSWADTSHFGTDQFMFAENNTFSVPPASSTGRGFDCQFGGRGVFRNNTLSNAGVQEHGTGSDTRDRGCRAVEVYGNSISGPSPNFAFMVQIESGTGLWWNNTVSGFNSLAEVDTVRQNNATYTQAAPPNGWGYCGTQVNGSSSVWDQNLSTDGHACMDGVGYGKGDLLTGGSGGSFTGTVDSATGTQAWPTQALDPTYFWGNAASGLTNAYVFALSSPGTAENREWYTERPNFSSGTAFDGTAGIGCGPLAGIGCANPVTQPATCTPGVGYWKPAVSTLFVCAAGNAFTAYYTPYLYPHPLADLPTWGNADEWLQMNIGNVGSAVTTPLLASGSVGAPAMSYTLSPSTPAGYTFATSQGSMGGSINLGNITYPVGTPTEALALSNANNFTYFDSMFGNSQKQVVANGFITLGAANATFNGHPYDMLILGDTTSAGSVVLQFNNGNPCYCFFIETNGAGGFIGRSSGITATPGGRYSFSLLFDEIAGVAKLAIYDPSNNFAQVGLVTQAQSTGNNFNRLRMGNAEVGTSTGTNYFEDVMLDWTDHVFPNNPQFINGAPKTWTYVQESVITYCANNTSSCGNFAGTMIPTRSDTVWVFGISTTNDVTATVSGGGATWTECATCTTFLSGFRRNRVFYALGGTAGSTNFTITLSGNSGSAFAVTFVELLPPSGASASFDVGGAASSSTCTGTCTGVGFTLSATDAVVQFMNRIAPADYKAWPSPYLTLPNGDGLHLNALAGTEAAPVVNTQAGSTGAVFSAIAFKSTAVNFTPPSAGPMSLVQFIDPDPASGLTGLNCAPSCNLAVGSTGSGHLLYLEAANTAGNFLTGVSGGGTWVVPVSCQIKGGQAVGNALSCAYVLSSTSGATSLSITMAGTASTQFAFYELASSTGAFSFDTAGSATNAASFNPSGVALSLSQIATDAVFQSIFQFGGASSLSYFPYIRGCRSGCGPQFWNGQAASDLILNVSGSAPTPQFSNQQNNSTVVTGVAFSTPNTSGSPVVQFNPLSLSYPIQAVGTSSPTQAIILSNTGTAALAIGSIAVTGVDSASWSQSNNCGSSLAQNATCTINVTFAPVSGGSHSATLSLASNAPSSPDIVSLSGTASVQMMKGNALILGNVLIKVSP